MSRRKPGPLFRARQAVKFFRHGFDAFRPIQLRSDFEQKKAPFIWPTWRQGKPTWQIVDYLNYAEEGFNLNSVIYSAIMYKVRAITSAPLRAYTGTYQAPELLDVDHPLSKLCARPNVFQSWAEFQGLAEVYLNLSGNCYVLVDRGKRGEEIPQALYLLRPDRMYIVPGRQSGNVAKMLGYIYVPEGKTQHNAIPFLPQDIMHIKLPNPLDSLEGMGYGLSPIAPMARSADVDNEITRYLKLFFEKGAMPPGLLKFDIPMTEADVAAARERWQEIYGGVDNWSDVAVLDQGGEYQRLGLGFDEMGFGVIDERNEARILGPFGVPPILIGTRYGLARSTYSNYEQARRAFWEDTMVPELGWFEVEYRYYLRTEDGAFVKFDYSEVPALQHDIPALVTSWSALVAGGVPGLVAAETVGLALPEYPGSRTSFRPMAMMPSGTMKEDGTAEEPTLVLPEPTPPADEGEEGAPEAVEEAEEAEDEGKGQKGDEPLVDMPGETQETPETPEEMPDEEPLTGSPLSTEAKAAFWKAHDQFALTWEERFADAAYEALDHDRREILAIVNGAKAKALQDKATIAWMKTFLTIKQYLGMGAADNWRDVFAPVMHTMIAERAEQLDAEFGIAFNVHNWLAEDWFDQYTITFAQPINADTEKAIRMMCKQATEEGWSMYTMTNHLETMFTQWMKGGLSPEEFAWYDERMPMYRRENIARTEEMGALGKGNWELYKGWNAKKKEWLGVMDNRIRDTHAAANGQVREIDQPFNVGGYPMQHPGDKSAPPEEICQCRCSVLPVIE